MRWGAALSLTALVVAAFMGGDSLPVGPLPIYFLACGLRCLLAPYERRLAWLAQARGELVTPATRYDESVMEVALREARQRRLLLLALGIISVVVLLLLLRERQFAGLAHVLVPLAVVLFALWRTVLDIRDLETGRRAGPRRRALRRLFS